MSILDECDDVSPSRGQFPIARRVDCLVLNLRVGAFQGLQYLIVKTANPAHRKYSRQHPLFVSAGICSPDRVLMPLSGRAPMLPKPAAGPPWECYCRNTASGASPGYYERAPSDGYIFQILESIFVRLFEDRPEGNCSPGAQSLWLVCTAYDRSKESANSLLMTVKSPANSTAIRRSDSLARSSIRIS